MRRNLSISLLLIIFAFAFSSTSCADSVQRMESDMSYQEYLVKEAEVPQIPQCPDINNSSDWDDETLAQFNTWWEAKDEHQGIVIPNVEQLQKFICDSVRKLNEDRETQNFLYSPISLWLSLHTLANLTEGNSQTQILQAIGQQTDEERDKQLDAVYKSLYWEEDASTCVPALSIWIDKNTEITDTLLARFAAGHTSVFQGNMGTAAYDEALRLWLNEQTRGLLKDSVSQLRFEPNSGLSVCSTLYIKNGWSMPFNEKKTSADVFYSESGEVTTDFMHSSDEGVVFQGNGFTSAFLDFRDGGGVALILPDDGRSPGELLNEDDVFRFLFSRKDWTDGLYGKVNLSVPKIDFLTDISLKRALGKLGISDIFNPQTAHFSQELTSDTELFVSSLEQYARLY